MRVGFRRLRHGQLDHELIWLSVTVLAGAIMFGWLSLHLPWPRCTFRALFGIPCLTCGSTRSALAFFRGDFLGAWHFNPLATLVFGSIAVFDLYALGTVIGNGRRLRIIANTRSERRILTFVLVAASGWNWCFLLRNSHGADKGGVAAVSANAPTEAVTASTKEINRRAEAINAYR